MSILGTCFEHLFWNLLWSVPELFLLRIFEERSVTANTWDLSESNDLPLETLLRCYSWKQTKWYFREIFISLGCWEHVNKFVYNIDILFIKLVVRLPPASHRMRGQHSTHSTISAANIVRQVVSGILLSQFGSNVLLCYFISSAVKLQIICERQSYRPPIREGNARNTRITGFKMNGRFLVPFHSLLLIPSGLT